MSVEGLDRFDELLTEEIGTLEGALWVAVALALVGDVVTTFVGLHIGLSESNPIADRAITSAGVIGMLALKALAVAVALVLRTAMPPEYRAIVPAALAVPWGLAAVYNVVVISTTI